ncbi:MAG: glycosyltransferase [Flavobacteriales bacterium]|nr:glycosyltransferase [Bacteroidota bacterium]MCB9239546.1 glycosyltransferase [Flavobacteriales bacterium]
MRILQVSNRIPYPLNEGGTIGIYNYTRGFSEAGCEVVLMALAPQKHPIEPEVLQRELGPFCELHTFPINTDVKPIPALLNLFSNRSYNVDRFYSTSFEQALISLLSERTFDVIQIEGTFPALYTSTILAHRKSARVILRQHNVEFQIWERLARNATNPLKKWYLSLLAKRLKAFEIKHLNQYDALVPVTPDDGELFQKMGCTIPVFPSPAGIDTERWHPAKEARLQHIFHIGSLEWMPNLEAVEWFIHEIWPSVHVQHPELHFHVAGKAMPESLKSISIPGVHMIGEVESAPDFIADKAITVVPLKSGSGIRLKILEAMSAGKIVISTTIGAQGIRYTSDSDILLADTPEQFMEVFNRLLSNQELQQKLMQNGRKLIEEEYSNQSVIKRLLDFYAAL